MIGTLRFSNDTSLPPSSGLDMFRVIPTVSGHFATLGGMLDRVGMSRAAARATVSLRYRDFRLLWFGSCVSSVGTWTQAVAENWLVLSITGSPFFLGLDAFLQQVPILLLTPIGGVLADRRDRRWTLIVSQCVQMSAAAILAVLVFTERVSMWHILALSCLSGCAQAFGGPAYQALTPALVGSSDVTNAVALNSLQFNLARFLGPLLAIGSILGLKWWGASEAAALSACFALNAVSFVFAIAALASLRVAKIARTRTVSVVEDMRSGIAYIRRSPNFSAILALTGVIALAGYPTLTLLPLLAPDLSAGRAEGYSALMVCAGSGAVAGAILAAWLGAFPQMEQVALIATGTLGLLVIACGFASRSWLMCVLVFSIGACLLLMSSLLCSLVHVRVPDRLRGRVMGVYLVASRGGMALGSLIAGWGANVTSASHVLAIGGVTLCLVSSWGLIWRPVNESKAGVPLTDDASYPSTVPLKSLP